MARKLPAGFDNAATAHEARVVLNVTGYDYAGYAGDWARLLCQFAFKCDRHNRALLRLSFPAMVDAVDLFQNVSLEAVRLLAESEESAS
jgi:hypothetical protein